MKYVGTGTLKYQLSKELRSVVPGQRECAVKATSRTQPSKHSLEVMVHRGLQGHLLQKS